MKVRFRQTNARNGKTFTTVCNNATPLATADGDVKPALECLNQVRIGVINAFAAANPGAKLVYWFNWTDDVVHSKQNNRLVEVSEQAAVALDLPDDDDLQLAGGIDEVREIPEVAEEGFAAPQLLKLMLPTPDLTGLPEPPKAA